MALVLLTDDRASAGAVAAGQAMLSGGRALSSGSVRIYAHACRPFQSGSRPLHRSSRGADHHCKQHTQQRVSAVQQATAVEAPPGLLTVPWDDTPEQQQVVSAALMATLLHHLAQRSTSGA